MKDFKVGQTITYEDLQGRKRVLKYQGVDGYGPAFTDETGKLIHIDYYKMDAKMAEARCPEAIAMPYKNDRVIIDPWRRAKNLKVYGP